MSELSKLCKASEVIKMHWSKINIFDYPTSDEIDKSGTQSRLNVTVEIGGPSTHIKFAIKTREEHTLIKHAVESILTARLDKINSDIDDYCQTRINNKEAK